MAKVKRPPAGAGANEKHMVPVVGGTFQILEELSRPGRLGLNEITQRTGVSKPTVFRILTALNRLGYVVRDDNRNDYNSPGEPGQRGGHHREPEKHLALPHMLQLRDKFGETVNLGHLLLDRVENLEVVPSEYALRCMSGPKRPSACTRARRAR